MQSGRNSSIRISSGELRSVNHDHYAGHFLIDIDPDSGELHRMSRALQHKNAE
jgi:hypothetical protein